MLILSRRENENIVFPQLQIKVGVVRIRGNAVRIGVNAPEGVRILREEIADEEPQNLPERNSIRELRHNLRDRLNTANLALHLATQQNDLGRHGNVSETLRKALAELQSLDTEINNATRTMDPVAPSKLEQKGRRALIVEDNANERELLAGCLSLSGFDVATVDDGLSAVNYLEQAEQHPSCVLIDMRLPRLNGKDTIAAIRENPDWKGLRLFAVTGANRSEYEIPDGPDGVDGWFVKPVNPAKLVEKINAADKPLLSSA